MKDEFNPYHAWLGIPPENQPCTHYRLLGLEEFESNVDVIEAASERQIAHVRNYQLKYPELATEVLHALVQAKSCLLSCKERMAYDQTLVQLREVNPTSPLQDVTKEATVSAKPPIEIRLQTDANRRNALQGAKTSIYLRSIFLILGGGCGICIAVFLLWVKGNFNQIGRVSVPNVHDPSRALRIPNELDRRALKSEKTPPLSDENSEGASFPTTPAKSHSAYQNAWAERLKVPAQWTNELRMSFVLIPPGNFMMGSTAAENEQLLMNGRKQIRKDLFPAREAAIKATTPQRMVQITTPFYISVFETTVSDFLRVTKGIASTDRHPVASISWDDADAFCRKLSGQPKVRGDYRLPTSAEWEYACRAGTKGLFYFDPDLDKLHNHHARLLSRPPVVGSKDSNPWCVHDMYGSLGEWTSDWAWPGPQDKTNGADPRGPVDGEERVIRGCGWNNRLVSIQSVERATAMPDVTSSNVGFRVVLDVSSVKEMLGQQSTN